MALINRFSCGIILLCVYYFRVQADDVYCKSSGYIDPPDVVNAGVNDTVELKCILTTMDSQNCSIDSLGFYDENYTRITDGVTITSENSITLRIERAEYMRRHLHCKHDKTGIAPISIRVGHKPQPAKISCVSYNYETLQFIIKESPNSITPNYTATYSPIISKSVSHITNCNITRNERDELCCDVLIFRARNYEFVLTTSNALGSINQTFTCYTQRAAIPNPPEDVTTNHVTPKGATLSWRLPYLFLEGFNEKFVHRITKKSLGIIEEPVEEFQLDMKNMYFSKNITVKHAHLRYEILIAYRVANATNNATAWSNETTINLTTVATRPDRPPHTNLGAFYFLNNHEVNIFWKELSSEESNGDGLNYTIDVYMDGNPDKTIMTAKQMHNATARFDKIYATHKYEFRIYSNNFNGRSLDYSTIIIPTENDRIPLPNPSSKHLSNRVYTLIWKKADLRHKILSYTIFWCEPMDEQDTLCSTSMNYVQVPGTHSKYIFNNTKEESTKIFAISANTKDSRSGMEWFPCSASNYSDMTKFKAQADVLIPAVFGAHGINISWTLRCDTTLALQGYKLYYCAVTEQDNKTCNGPELLQYKVVADRERQQHMIISNLTAFTMYKLSMAMFNGNESGPNVTLYSTTNSEPPSQPQNLFADHITNKSLLLNWEHPNRWNGAEPSYKIILYKYVRKNDEVTDEKISLAVNKIDLINNMTQELSNLQSYTNYTIAVVACNKIYCSEESEPLFIRTEIGKPGYVRLISPMGSQNYEWEPPLLPGGLINFYEFKIEIKRDGIIETVVSQVLSTKCTLTKKTCENNEDDYNFFVRGINVISRNTTPNYRTDLFTNSQDLFQCEERIISDLNEIDYLPGDWIEYKGTVCKYVSVSIIYTFLILGAFLFVAIMIVGFKKFQKIKTIPIELPPGLENINKEKAAYDNSQMDQSDKSDVQSLTTDEQTQRLIRAHNISTSSCSLENKSKSSEICFESDNENTLNDDDDHIDYDKLTANDSCEVSMAADAVTSKATKDADASRILAALKKPPAVIVPMNIPQVQSQIGVENKNNKQSLQNGYVSNTFMMPPNMIPANGYVQHQAMMARPPVTSPYTPIAAFVKQNKVEQPKVDANFKTPIVTSTNGISGYVTHKQLSEFHNTLMQ